MMFVREYSNVCGLPVLCTAPACLCVACARNTQALISVQLLVFFPVEQQSEAFSAKALVNNSG